MWSLLSLSKVLHLDPIPKPPDFMVAQTALNRALVSWLASGQAGTLSNRVCARSYSLAPCSSPAPGNGKGLPYRLEEGQEQPLVCIDSPEERRSFRRLVPCVLHKLPHCRPGLLFHMGLVILLARTAAGERDPLRRHSGG